MALDSIVLFIGVLIFLVLFYVAITYNNLINLRTKIERSWAQIDVFLKRRYDLIPNLVETVKGYAKHERETLESVMKARAGLLEGSAEERGNATLATSKGMKTLFAVAENYPDLKANENFLKLQEELVATENSISYVRISYNDSVLDFNTALQTFPSSIIANMFGFKQKEFFQAKAEEREAIKITM